MNNLLRVEIFKIIRGKVFWMLLSIITAVAFALVILLFMNEKGILEEIDGVDITVEVDPQVSGVTPASGMDFFIEQIYAPDVFITILLISVLGSFLIATEHATGTIKNTVSIGYHRIEIYVAKYIIYAISSIVLILISPVILGVIGSLFFGVGDWPETEVLIQSGKITLLTCLYVIAFSSVVMLFAMVVNSSGLAFLVSLGFYLIFGPVLNLLAHQYVSFEKLNHYSLYNRFSLLADNDLAVKDLIELGMLPVIWGIIFVVIGLVIFKKKDIQ